MMSVNRKDLVWIGLAYGLATLLWLGWDHENNTWPQTMGALTVLWIGPELVHAAINRLAPYEDTTERDCVRAVLWIPGFALVMGAIDLVYWHPPGTGFFVVMLIATAVLALLCLWRAVRRLREFELLTEEDEDLDLTETQRRDRPPVPSGADARMRELLDRSKAGEIVDYVDREEDRHGIQGQRPSKGS